ncbi:GtrA family protein [Cyanobium sp. FGCU-6]|jgi:putative flippase GtrA|nr:GtrA family protein [Cyanobium sp. FGCU6]
MDQGLLPRITKHRLSRFCSVGVIATLIHAGILSLLQAGFDLPRPDANLMAFVVAFVVSMAGQQRFTFNDRLRGKRLNANGLVILFLVNATAAFGLGSVARGGSVILLPVLPAVINYVLLYLFSGSSRFRR